MSLLGGYQSNINLNNLNFVGDFPVNHSLGGFGTATGIDNYSISLNTLLSNYRQGLLILVMFQETNTGPVTVNVSGRGARALKKVTPGGLQDLATGEISALNVYLLVYDGIHFQLANAGGAPDASETQKGIAMIATPAETTAGLDNTKIVTPARLASFLADRITGLWTNKGFIDCSLNPNYPSGVGGEAYVISVAGKIGGPDGQRVGVRDVLVCNAINPGGPESTAGSYWTIIQANLEPASEIIAGYLRIATQAETNAGLANDIGVSPLKLSSVLSSRLRYQAGTAFGAIIPQNGQNNVASGQYAIVSGGEQNQAIGAYSSASGLFAESTQINQWSKAGGAFFNTPGSSQCSVLNLLGTIPPNIGTGALTTNGISSDGPSWVPPDNSIQQITIQLSITQNAGAGGTPGQTWTGIYEGALRRQAGIVTWIGDPPSVRDIRQDPGFAPVAGFTVGGESVTLYIVSLSERILHCSATVYITQTKFSLS